MRDSLVIRANRSQKTGDSLEKFPFLCPRANHSRRSSLICSFLKSDLSDSLPPLFTKELPWAICSGRSWQKSDREKFTQVAHDKRATGAISSFQQANRSFVLLLTKNERIAQKPDERIHNPAILYCIIKKKINNYCTNFYDVKISWGFEHVKMLN